MGTRNQRQHSRAVVTPRDQGGARVACSVGQHEVVVTMGAMDQPWMLFALCMRAELATRVPASCFSGVASLAYGSAVSVPLASVVSTEMDVALTLSVDPSENLISLASPVMHVGPNDGNGTTTMLGVSFGSGFRVGSTATPPLRLAMHITGGFGCTRDVFGR